MMDEQEYFRLGDEYTTLLYDYLLESDTQEFNPDGKAWKALNTVGWLGIIPKEQREFYYNCYRRLYDIEDLTVARTKLAQYFAGSLARHKLGGLGTEKDWEHSFIQLNFSPPVPGDPFANNRVFYRTIPTCFTRDHMPPWRSKGYYRIYNDNTVKVGLTSWRSTLEFSTAALQLSRGKDSVIVETDYIIM